MRTAAKFLVHELNYGHRVLHSVCAGRHSLLVHWLGSGGLGLRCLAEEGGFIVKDPSGNLRVIRWPKGAQNTIVLPPHPGCKFAEEDIVATFHTHPNTGPDFLQEPSETDRRAVADDPDLKGPAYEGEFVISQRTVYLIAPTGQVSEVGSTREILET